MRKTVVIVLNTLAAQIIAVCALRYVTEFFILSFVNSLVTHILLAVCAMLVVTLLIRRQMASVVLLALAMGLTGHSIMVKRAHAISPTIEEVAMKPALRVLSFNMLYENLENSAAISQMILASGADIAIIPEGAPLLFHLPELSAAYPYRFGCGAGTATCDLMVFSKLPLENMTSGTLSDLRKDRLMRAVVEVQGVRVRVVAAHLSKPYFDRYHQDELYTLKAILGNDPGPIIIAGDFNSGSIAPDMQRLLRQMNLKTAPAEPGTWPVALAPYGLGIAIDHIYARPPLIAQRVTRLPDNYGSNHYGLMADFILRKP
ncbi:hypothetical protein BJF93_09545 [Xaviernesmea oryzae]|uniref:Endonuclease/exonuclease/phosphatase domain-containing protein n=1 Tax=Xaviernesmea oryzae TaxID=464029 RepID=A0A1Q9AWP9_9HYPH|nr:endonuclease/exonuclease/phosphatase family protein [Xaviernesmea oryzae]OLP59848.1 hypothetical protein BJF93_09545 [Xaviernesmea oryzae]SEK49153.1 Uncharacterized conserved protein YafD, endonuclease/exonuclease/phosphatase (EEP) superfamily [Xaviernesmea oryzae]